MKKTLQKETIQPLSTGEQNQKERLHWLDKTTEGLIFRDLEGSLPLLREQQQLAESLHESLLLANAFNKMGFVQNQLYDHPSALACYERALALYVQLDKETLANDLRIDMAAVLLNLDDYHQTHEQIEKARTFFDKLPSENMKGRIFCREAYLQWRKGNYEKAASSFMVADELLSAKNTNKTKDVYFKMLIFIGLGWIYDKREDFSKSIELYRQAIDLGEKYGITSRMTWYYLYLGNALNSKGEEKEAELLYNKIISENATDRSPYSRAGAYGNLGKIYLQRGELKKALSMFDAAESVYAQGNTLDDYYNLAELYRNIGKMFEGIGDDKNALRFYEKAIEKANIYQDHDQLAALYRQAAHLFARKKRFKMAYQHEIAYARARESAIDKEKARTFSELQVRYEAAKKERIAESLRLQATELQLKALRAQMNPHFIFNCLNSIQKHIITNDSKSAELYLSKFAKLMRSILENSERNVISLEDEVQFLKDYLSLEKLRFKDEFSHSIIIDDDIEEDIMGVPPMLVQPHVENAIIHGIRGVNNGHISIKFSMKNEHTILCVVDDNGIGRENSAKQYKSFEKKHRSLGTFVTLQRLQLLNETNEGQLMVDTIDKKDENGQPTGTRVEIQIPIQQLIMN